MVKHNEEVWAAKLARITDGSAQSFREFVRIIAKIRHPVRGCPWDLEQSHESLRRYMLEEAYEASEALASGDPGQMMDELGDVLLQVVLNAQLLADAEHGDIQQIIEAISAKMRRRHPHVFERSEQSPGLSPTEVKQQWQEIKDQEKSADQKQGGTFAKAKSKRFPASLQAMEIGKIAHRIDFDWDQPEQVLDQLESEIKELRAELQTKPQDKQAIAAELGDVYFTLSQLTRHLALDAEVVAQSGNLKFLDRFDVLEDLAAKQGLDIKNLSREKLEVLWQQAKKTESP